MAQSLKATLKELFEAEAGRNQADFILSIVGDDPKAIAILVEFTEYKEHFISHRSAWSLDIMERKHPEYLDKHFSKIMEILAQTKSDSVKRSLMNIVSRRHIPKDQQGFWVDFCFNILEDKKEKVGAQANALTILGNIAKEEPDLIPELLSFIRLHHKDASTGLKTRARHIEQKLLNT